VRDLFRKFKHCGNYAKTERYIDDEYGTEYLNGHRVKTILQNRVYIGQPRLPESWLEDTTYENDLHEPDLHLLKDQDGTEVDVCEATFHQAQEIIQEKEQERPDDNTMGLLDFVEEFSLFRSSRAAIQLPCSIIAVIRSSKMDRPSSKVSIRPTGIDVGIAKRRKTYQTTTVGGLRTTRSTRSDSSNESSTATPRNSSIPSDQILAGCNQRLVTTIQIFLIAITDLVGDLFLPRGRHRWPRSVFLLESHPDVTHLIEGLVINNLVLGDVLGDIA